MSKMMKTIVTLLVVLLIGVVAALVVVMNTKDASSAEDEGQTIDEIIEYSHETEEITTDLDDGSFVRIQFKVVTDSKDATEEVAKRDFQLRNIIIKQLATKTEEDFKSNLTELETALKTEINTLMTEGEVTEVYTISKILQ